MTKDALKAIILADTVADIGAKALADKGNDQGAAERVNEIAPKEKRPTLITFFDIQEKTSAAIASKIVENVLGSTHATAPLIKETQHPFRNGGVDISKPVVIAMINTFVNKFQLSPAEAAQVIALGDHKPQVTADEVSEAWAEFRTGGKITT